MSVKQCACGATLAQRNRTGRCLSCAVKWSCATQPGVIEARRRAGKASVATAEQRAARSERANAQELWRIGHQSWTDETHARRGRSVSNARMAWCPPELRDEARRLTYRKRFALAEVKEIIAAEHEVLMRRWREGLQ